MAWLIALVIIAISGLLIAIFWHKKRNAMDVIQFIEYSYKETDDK
ncbi:MAG TPA: hypothetical protein VGH05_10215 [Buttiauxella sp.]|jgi:hypothetical protein